MGAQAEALVPSTMWYTVFQNFVCASHSQFMWNLDIHTIQKCASGMSEELTQFTSYEKEVLFSRLTLEFKTTVQFWDHQFYTVITKNETCSIFLKSKETFQLTTLDGLNFLPLNHFPINNVQKSYLKGGQGIYGRLFVLCLRLCLLEFKIQVIHHSLFAESMQVLK